MLLTIPSLIRLVINKPESSAEPLGKRRGSLVISYTFHLCAPGKSNPCTCMSHLCWPLWYTASGTHFCLGRKTERLSSSSLKEWSVSALMWNTCACDRHKRNRQKEKERCRKTERQRQAERQTERQREKSSGTARETKHGREKQRGKPEERGNQRAEQGAQREGSLSPPVTQRGQTGGTWEVGSERGIEVGRKAAGGTENWGYGWTKARQKDHRGHGEKKEKRKVKHIEGGATCDTKKLSDITAPSLEVNLFWAAENRWGANSNATNSGCSHTPGSDKKLALCLKINVMSSTYTTPLHITLS